MWGVQEGCSVRCGCRKSTTAEQEGLLDLLWALWEELPVFGRKAAQFVDLLGFFVLKTPSLPEHKVSQTWLQSDMASVRHGFSQT